jgi:indoleamine 2,3-dioxygenase
MTACDLSIFGLSETRGFLPHTDPLLSLPAKFAAWEHVAQKLPKYLAGLSLRKAVNSLPPFPTDALKDEAEFKRAMVILSFIGHAYVFGEKPTVDRIPEVLAKPWYEVAKKLGRPPVLSYESYALDNWERLDPNGPIAMGNVALAQNFLAGLDEEWFVIVHVDIEARAAQALKAIASGRKAVVADDAKALTSALKEMACALDGMYQSLCAMVLHCDPFMYFHRVRPYIHGWKNNPSLPNGLIYEGVQEYGGVGQFFRGETGAQSTIIPSLDGFLGVGHVEDILKTYLMEMRTYMPPKHKAFLEAVEAGPSTRDFVMKHSADAVLQAIYNECVDWVEKFRTKHLEYAVSYIAKQAQTDPSNPSQVGTGGTPFVKYLTKHRDETGQHKTGCPVTGNP